MQLGRAFRDRLPGDLDAFRDRMRVGVFLPGAPVKTAEFAVRHANVRVIEMPVDVVISHAPVFAAAHEIRQFPERVEILRVVQIDAFFKGQTVARLDLFGDPVQVRIK